MGYFQIPADEKSYPAVVRRETITPPHYVLTDNGTSLPTIAAPQFMSLFVAGSKGEIVDFAALRFDVKPTTGTQTVSLRYIADGTTPATGGASVGISSAVIDMAAVAEDTKASFTIGTTTCRVPANALVYLAWSAAPTGIQGLVIDVGHRVFAN